MGMCMYLLTNSTAKWKKGTPPSNQEPRFLSQSLTLTIGGPFQMLFLHGS